MQAVISVFILMLLTGDSFVVADSKWKFIRDQAGELINTHVIGVSEGTSTCFSNIHTSFRHR